MQPESRVHGPAGDREKEIKTFACFVVVVLARSLCKTASLHLHFTLQKFALSSLSLSPNKDPSFPLLAPLSLTLMLSLLRLLA
jgi:hypothetical protein